MLKDMEPDYVHKYDQMRSYVDLMLHEAMKLRPDAKHLRFSNASSRLTSTFIERLERQFPIDSKAYALEIPDGARFCRSTFCPRQSLEPCRKRNDGPHDNRNHFRPHCSGSHCHGSTQHVKYFEIAYSLGFDYPAHFNNFFKKQTGKTPGDFRSLRAASFIA